MGDFMKKLLLSILFVLPILFVGCSKIDDLNEVSKNLNSYDIVATLDAENKLISANETVIIQNSSDYSWDYVCFHLHPNAFKENRKENFAVSLSQEDRAYDGEKGYGSIEIKGVQENGQETSFEIQGEDEHILRINTQNSLKKGDKTNIIITFLVSIPKVNHRLGYGEHTINLGNWYPILCVFEDGEWNTDGYLPTGDPFYSKMANYDVEISYDNCFSVASTGSLIEENEEGGVKTSKYSAKAVRDFAMVFSKSFEKVEQTVGKTSVEYYFYDDENPERHLKTAVDALNTFNELIGEYPYNSLCVVKSNFLHGGMEYPMLVYVSDQIANENEYNNVIIHEIAHQWWYGLVGNNELKFGFIDEGLAEYSTALFYELNDGYGTTKDEVIGNALSSYLLYCDVYHDVYGKLNTSINRDIKTFNTETEYVYLTYVKGLLMFDAISEVVGQKKMNKCLKGLFEDWCYFEVTPEGMIESFEKHSHRKLRSFITSWLDGSVVLESIQIN